MQKNSENFSMQDALRLAKSDAGQQLLALLQQSDPSMLQSAADQAAAGNMDAVRQMLAPLLASDEVKQLMKQMEG